MISQLCGPKAKKAILLALCAVLFIGLIVYFGVTFGGSLVGSIVAKAVWVITNFKCLSIVLFLYYYWYI